LYDVLPDVAHLELVLKRQKQNEPRMVKESTKERGLLLESRTHTEFSWIAETRGWSAAIKQNLRAWTCARHRQKTCVSVSTKMAWLSTLKAWSLNHLVDALLGPAEQGRCNAS
jgi:hypothetical protein